MKENRDELMGQFGPHLRREFDEVKALISRSYPAAREDLTWDSIRVENVSQPRGWNIFRRVFHRQAPVIVISINIKNTESTQRELLKGLIRLQFQDFLKHENLRGCSIKIHFS